MLLALSATQCAEQQAQPMRIITPAEVAQAIAAIDARAPKAPVTILPPEPSRSLSLKSIAIIEESRAMDKEYQALKTPLNDALIEENYALNGFRQTRQDLTKNHS